MSSLSDVLRSGGGDFVKAKDLVGQVVTVVDFTHTSYEFRGQQVPSVDVHAVDGQGTEIKISGTATMGKNLQAAKDAGFEFPLDLRIVAFPVAGGGTGYGFNDPNE